MLITTVQDFEKIPIITVDDYRRVVTSFNYYHYAFNRQARQACKTTDLVRSNESPQAPQRHIVTIETNLIFPPHKVH